MSKQIDMLARLGGLNESDRSWILSKLSVSAREKLLRGERVAPPMDESKAAAERTRNATPSSDVSEDLVALRRVDARVMVQVLRDESPFFIAALLASHAWPWRDAVLDAMTPIQSANVVKLIEGLKITPEMCEALLQVAASSANRIEPPVVAQVPSKFELLVERIGASRSQRRATRL